MPNSRSKIKLAVLGAHGKMGQRIIALATHDSRFQLMAGVERAGGPTVGHFIGGTSVPVVGDVGEILPKADVLIDFTSPESTLRTARLAARSRRGLVIGTTGFSPKGLKVIKAISRKIPIVFSPNMSVGVNLLFQLVAQAARSLAHYDIEIVEAHHNLKKDSPSGTALKLAEVAAQASQRSSKDYVYGRHGQVGARKKKEIGIFSVRAGDIIGDHTVLLSNTGERLELTHRAHSRDAFASGSLDAAAWIYKKRPGLYSMQDVLKGKN